MVTASLVNSVVVASAWFMPQVRAKVILETGTKVAIKEFFRGDSMREVDRKRFERGQVIYITATLALVRILDVGDIDDSPYLVMTLLKGDSLEQRMSDERSLGRPGTTDSDNGQPFLPKSAKDCMRLILLALFTVMSNLEILLSPRIIIQQY